MAPNAQGQGQTVNVTQVIDGGRFGGFQWMVAIWCFVLVTLDGFDNGAINFAAPVIAKEWGIAMPAFTSVFGAGLFGLMIGALASGPLADRFGRKLVLLTSTLVFSVFALATALGAFDRPTMDAALLHRHGRRRPDAEFDRADRRIRAEAHPRDGRRDHVPGLSPGRGRSAAGSARRLFRALAGRASSFSAACCR